MVFQSQVALSSFLFVFLHKDAAAYIVENPRELPNLMPPRSKQNGGGLAPPSFANQDLQLVGQQGLLGETNDMMKRLSLGFDYAVAPVLEAPLEDTSEASVEDLLEEAQVEEAAIRQEQIEPTKTLKEPIVTGWDVSEEAEEEEVVATVAEPEAMTPPPVEKEEEANEIAPAQQDEQKVSLTMAVDDFTAKFMQRKRVNSVLTPPPRPIVNLKPAFVAEKKEAPAAPGIVVSSRIQDFIDYPMGTTTLQNEEQEIPTLVAEENDNVKESDESQERMDSSQLQKMNKAAASGQTDYFANRYHYDSWFDNPNSNNLFLRAMHIE